MLSVGNLDTLKLLVQIVFSKKQHKILYEIESKFGGQLKKSTVDSATKKVICTQGFMMFHLVAIQLLKLHIYSKLSIVQ